MNMLPELAVLRLEKILSQLECESDGVRLASVAAATRVLQEHGFRWCQVSTLAQPPPSQPHRPTYRASPIRTWRDTCAELVERKGCLNRWEVGFVSRLPDFRVLSIKQRRILDEIAFRVLGSSE
jgi:hypothetical protein